MDAKVLRKERVCGLPWLTREYSAQGVVTRFFKREISRRNWKELGYRLGASYNLYDGEELLEASARSIRPNVDFITVVYQDVSNAGERRTEPLAPMLEDLRSRGLVDDFVKYDPDLSLKPAQNEYAKRLIGLERARRHGCTHHLDLDVDEFYRASEMAAAKDFVFARGVDVSAVPFCYYLKKPTWRAEHYGYFVPFIIRIPDKPLPHAGGAFPCIVDPTRILRVDGRFYVFRWDEIAMHHMSTVRRDLARKFRNSSISGTGNAAVLARMNDRLAGFEFGRHELPEDLDFHSGMLIRRVDDEFGVGEL